jgi:hypothetical protein
MFLRSLIVLRSLSLSLACPYHKVSPHTTSLTGADYAAKIQQPT